MKPNSAIHVSLLMILLGLPAGVTILPKAVLARQNTNLNFRDIRFSSVGIKTLINGTATTTITLSIQNYGSNSYSFNDEEIDYLRKILLVDAKNNGYYGQFEDDLRKPFFSGENRLVKLNFRHPMGIYLTHLHLETGEQNQSISIRL